jgi:hypothetical protein
MRSVHLVVAVPAFMLLGCSEAPGTPLAPDISQPSQVVQVSTDFTKLLLPALNYSAVEVGTAVSFSFMIPLTGIYSRVLAPTANGHDPESFQFQEAVANQPTWIQGAGLIHSIPPDAVGAPFVVFGQGTVSIPVTGTRTEDGQTSTVTGTLVIVLEEDVVEPKLGSPYLEPCGSACVRFQLRATFSPTGAIGPLCIVSGELTALDPQQTEPI